jgi:hypothetical protein
MVLHRPVEPAAFLRTYRVLIAFVKLEENTYGLWYWQASYNIFVLPSSLGLKLDSPGEKLDADTKETARHPSRAYQGREHAQYGGAP